MTAFNRPSVKSQAYLLNGVDITKELTRLVEMRSSVTLIASGAIAADKHLINVAHGTVAVLATIADFADHAGGLVVISNTSASGVVAHTVTLTAGTFDGTNNKITLDAPGESITVFVKADGNGFLIRNSTTLATV